MQLQDGSGWRLSAQRRRYDLSARTLGRIGECKKGDPKVAFFTGH